MKSPENRILASLSIADQQRLAPHLTPVELAQGTKLYKAGARIRDVYFPSTAILSFVSKASKNQIIEVGMVGCEGVMGVSSVLSGLSPYEALVQIRGAAMRMDAATFNEEFQSNRRLKAVIHAYLNALMMQTSQTIACNRFHPTAQRMARWLLITRDRLPTDEMPLTHEYLSHMLGTRRASVTLALKELTARKLISRRRATIKVLNRRALEKYACDCYRIIKSAFRESSRESASTRPRARSAVGSRAS